MTVEAWYIPQYAFKSDVTGMTAQQYCDDFEATTGQQWTQPICFIGCFELWTDVLRRAKNPLDKASIVEAIKGTNVTLTGGPVDWTVNPEPKFGFWNFCSKPLAGGQWVKDTTGKHKYDDGTRGQRARPGQHPGHRRDEADGVRLLGETTFCAKGLLGLRPRSPFVFGRRQAVLVPASWRAGVSGAVGSPGSAALMRGRAAPPPRSSGPRRPRMAV